MFMGHFSTSITYDTYVHLTNDKSHSEMNKLEELYSKIPLEKLAKRSFGAKKVGQKLAETH